MSKKDAQRGSGSSYREPQIVTVGEVSALTGAGGPQLVDSYGNPGDPPTDWTFKNHEPPADEIGEDVLQ